MFKISQNHNGQAIIVPLESAFFMLRTVNYSMRLCASQVKTSILVAITLSMEENIFYG